jgi:hypothetical protein
MENKSRLITPFLMLLAGAIASIIMYIRGYELTRMLWGLLIVLVIFYILGDVARYLYASVRPRIIPVTDLDAMVIQARKNSDLTGSVVEFSDEETENTGEGESAQDEEQGYSDEELEEYETSEYDQDSLNEDGEYSDETDNV